SQGAPTRRCSSIVEEAQRGERRRGPPQTDQNHPVTALATHHCAGAAERQCAGVDPSTPTVIPRLIEELCAPDRGVDGETLEKVLVLAVEIAREGREGR